MERPEAMVCLSEDRHPAQASFQEAMEVLQVEAVSSIPAPSSVPILHVNPFPQALIWDRMSVTIVSRQV